MALAEQRIYLLPAWGALMLFCWYWISRNTERGTAVGPIFGTLLAHIPILVMIGIEAAAMKDFGLPRDAILWMGAFLAAGLRMPFVALCMIPLDIGGITGILMQGFCSLRYLPIPERVPPVPTPATTASIFPSVSRQSSRAVLS